MCQLGKNWNKLFLGVLEENIWGDLQSKLAYLHHPHKRRKEKKRKEKKEKLPLHPFNLSVTHQICYRNRNAKLNFEYGYLQGLRAGEIDHTYDLFSDAVL